MILLQECGAGIFALLSLVVLPEPNFHQIFQKSI